MGMKLYGANAVYKKESGQGMVEYGLILLLITLVTVGALSGVGDIVKNFFDVVDYLNP